MFSRQRLGDFERLVPVAELRLEPVEKVRKRIAADRLLELAERLDDDSLAR